RVGARARGNGGRGGRGGGVGERAEVAGGVARADAVAVAGLRGGRGVAVAGAGAGAVCEMREVAAADTLATLDLVAGDRGVVGGSAPRELNPARRSRGRGQRARLRRRH